MPRNGTGRCGVASFEGRSSPSDTTRCPQCPSPACERARRGREAARAGLRGRRLHDRDRPRARGPAALDLRPRVSARTGAVLRSALLLQGALSRADRLVLSLRPFGESGAPEPQRLRAHPLDAGVALDLASRAADEGPRAIPGFANLDAHRPEADDADP